MQPMLLRTSTAWLSLMVMVLLVPVSTAAALPPLSRDVGSTETDTCGVAICFAIDESGSIGSTNFAKSKEFVIDVIDGVSGVASGEGASQWEQDVVLHCS